MQAIIATGIGDQIPVDVRLRHQASFEIRTRHRVMVQVDLGRAYVVPPGTIDDSIEIASSTASYVCCLLRERLIVQVCVFNGNAVGVGCIFGIILRLPTCITSVLVSFVPTYPLLLLPWLTFDPIRVSRGIA